MVIPGAAFLRGSYLRAIHVLCNMVASPRFMVWISMGNECYVSLPNVTKGIILLKKWAMVKDPLASGRRMMRDVLWLYPVKFRSRL